MNEVVCDLTDIDRAGGNFDVFCALCEVVQDGILEVWDGVKRRQEYEWIERERREYNRINAPQEVSRQHG